MSRDFVIFSGSANPRLAEAIARELGEHAHGGDGALRPAAQPAAATHGLFVAGAREKLSHPAITELVVTDTVPVTESDLPPIRVISVAPIIAACLERLLSGGWRKHEPTIV
jgi:hypothetical protein